MIMAGWFLLVLVLIFTKEGNDFIRDMYEDLH